ncbi:MAG: hypothetical protein ABIO76_05780 [Ginsengibacter sp.]
MSSSNQASLTSKIQSLYNSIDEKNYESMRGGLQTLINELINSDFSSLVHLLYKIDVDEKRLKQHLVQNANADSAAIIADLIIQRILQKIETRNKFSGNRPAGAEDSW